VTIRLSPGPGADFASEFGFDLDELEGLLESELQEIFNLVDPNDYLRAFADAEAFSSKGLAVDYASNPKALSFGIALNVTAAVGKDGFAGTSESERPVAGVAPNLSLMAGANLGALFRNKKLDRLNVYVNGFYISHNYHESFSGSRTTLGAHAQYKLVRGSSHRGKAFFAWGGLDASGGIQYGRYKLSLEEGLDTDISIGEVEEQGGTLRLMSTGRATFETTSVSFPLEVTTSARLLYILSLYGGVGMDIFAGSSKMSVDLDGEFIGEDGDDNQYDVGDVEISANESAGPRPGRLRFLAGLQLNLWRVRLFLQTNLAPDRAVGATFGFRVAW